MSDRRTWVVRTVEFTREMIDNAELSPPSETVKQIIRESGNVKLQPLLGPDWEECMRQLQREYWLGDAPPDSLTAQNIVSYRNCSI